MYVIVLKYVQLFCITLFFNNINCDQLLLHNEREDQQLYRTASCTAFCLNTNEIAATLQSCYKACNDDELQTRNLHLVQRNETTSLELVCRDSSKLVIKINQILNGTETKRQVGTMDTNITNNKFIYLIKVQESRNPFAERTIYLSNMSMVTIENLHSNKTYNVSATLISSNGEYTYIKSQKFDTMQVYYKPGNITQIFFDKFTASTNNASLVDVRVSWEPANDKTCFYDIFYHLTEKTDFMGLQIIPIRSPNELYHHVITELKQDEPYVVAIRAFNTVNMTRESELIWAPIRTPTCNQLHDYNTNICAPDKVADLTTNATLLYRDNRTVLINVEWAPPTMEPDSYIVQLYDYSDTDTLKELNFTGNSTGFSIKIQITGPGYSVHVSAVINGKVSEPTAIVTHFDWIWLANELKNHQDETVRFILVYSTIFVVIVLVAMLFTFIYVRRARIKQRDIEILAYNDLFMQLENEIDSKYNPDDPLEVDFQRVMVVNEVARGAFGRVWKCQIAEKKCKIIVAAKSLKENPTIDEIREFRREIELMKSVGKHPNVLAIVGYCTKNIKQLVLLTEFCSKGNLRDFLRLIVSIAKLKSINIEKNTQQHVPNITTNPLYDQKKSNDDSHNELKYIEVVSSGEEDFIVNNKTYGMMSDQIKDENIINNNERNEAVKVVNVLTLLNFAQQVAAGMEYLATKKVIHRDLAARNILVSDNLTLKIADFGLSRDVYLDPVYMKRGGGKLPIKWLAIESLTHQEYTTKSDVWSYGILLYEIFTLGGNPYPGIEMEGLLQRLISGYRMKKPQNCSDELYKLMMDCWQEFPHGRPSFSAIKDRLYDFMPKSGAYIEVLPNAAEAMTKSISVESYLKPVAI